ncbi:MAG: hypothetical protein NC115_01865 [Bacteroidales bacterium]|nr:hypothetical protein [Bacteroidales bacterium]
MNWKEELQNCIDNKDWDRAMAMMQDVLVSENYSIDAYLNYFFIFEEMVTFPSVDFKTILIDKAERFVLPLHKESMNRYSENAEYLFWHGFMMIRTNWLCNPDDSESERMLRKAYMMEPKNKLYAWAASEDKDERRRYEAEIINDHVIMENILKKGPVGIYLSELLHYSVEHANMNVSK